jgi:hypothetical protein
MKDYEELTLNAKYDAEATKCRLSIDGDVKNATNGNRKAGKNEEYIIALKTYSNNNKLFGYLEVAFKKLEDISYQCFRIWELANKKGDK